MEKKVNDLYEMWDIAEEIMMETIEDELREKWKQWMMLEDEEAEFDFEKEYESLLKIREDEMDDIASSLLGSNYASEEEFETLREIVEYWWREKPQRLDCNEFWDICRDQFEKDCYKLTLEILKSVK